MSDEPRSDDDRIDRAALDAFAAPEPPAGFADRVMAAASQKPRRRIRPAWIAAAMIAVPALVAWRFPVEGARETAARETISLGGRGLAVAESGAQLRWRVGWSGAARVHQTSGEVFYRVERGGPFVVETAAGEVRVEGTCFRVEVLPMKKQMMMAAAGGAALAATVMVTVYEGRVLYANERGGTSLQAGERASSRTGAMPIKIEEAQPLTAVENPSENATRDELLRRDAEQRAEISRLRDRVRAFEVAGSPTAKRDEEKSARPFFDPSRDELQALAKECKLKWDSPPIGAQPWAIGPKRAGEMGLSEQERLELNRIAAETNTRVIAELRALYVEVTGDKNGGESLAPMALENEILQKSPDEAVQSIFQRLAQERAEIVSPGDGKGAAPAERLMRMMTGLGDRFERDLGAAIGPDRARALRGENGGWGSRHQSSYGCPEGK